MTTTTTSTTVLTAPTHDFTRVLTHVCDVGDAGALDGVASIAPESGALSMAAAMLLADAAELGDRRCCNAADRAVSMLALVEDAAALAIQVARRHGADGVARDVERRRRALIGAVCSLAS